MVKLNQVDIHDAQTWFENLKKQLHTTDESAISITDQGLEDIATLLHQKKVGRWDDLMNDKQVEALVASNNKMNDVAELITAWFIRTADAKNFKTPPTELELTKTMYQLISQIFKTLRVEMSAAETPIVKETVPES